MATFCRHGEGRVVLTEESFLLYVVDGVIRSSDVALSAATRASLESRWLTHPPKNGRFSTRQIQASLRVPYDEDEHPDDCSLGSDDSWSEIEEEDTGDEED